MATEATKDQVAEKLNVLIRTNQDLFILQACLAGLRAEDIRRILKVDQLRVSSVLKYVRLARKRKD